MNFKNTYITLKDSDKTVERIKEIAKKYSEASGYELEDYLKEYDSTDSPDWDYLLVTHVGMVAVSTRSFMTVTEEITEQDLDNYLAEVGDSVEDSIGSLAEKLYTTLPPSNITISVNGNGHILIHGDKIPTVDATKLAAEDITKAYEALVMLEGLFVEGE